VIVSDLAKQSTFSVLTQKGGVNDEWIKETAQVYIIERWVLSFLEQQSSRSELRFRQKQKK
jgi:hypothetical protein